MKTETLKTIAALLVSASISSCALSKALYVGEDEFSPPAGPRFLEGTTHGENLNGDFPPAVYIKTKTQTFNLYHYYILRGGKIWYKSITAGEEPAAWTLFLETGLPHDPRRSGFLKTAAIAEISADADELAALSVEGNFYRYCFDLTIAHRSNVWLDRQGWPVEEPLRLDPRTAKNISWALGKRNAHVLYYEDIFGNQHHNGAMEIATTYMLLEDGQEICFADPGVPADFSRNYLGPERGAFKAAALAASASTMFVINGAGEMYTRLADFDTIGCDPMWFKYTYRPYTSGLSGTDYFSNLNEWALPAEDWRPQPPIALTGQAAISRHITILQNGTGNGARELRVAGLNESGETGFWTKAIFDKEWEFRTVPLYFGDAALLESGVRGERGETLDKPYRGYTWKGNDRENDWEYQIPNFNILEGGCDLRITRGREICVLKLHPVEMWSYLKRDYLPGRTGSPKLFFVTLEVPGGAFDGLSPAFAASLEQRYSKNDKKLFQYTLAAAGAYIIMRETGEVETALFLTDGSIPGQYPDFKPVRYIENFPEGRRYYGPELTLDRKAAISKEALREKIALNRAFLDELKYKIRVLRWSELTAFKFNAGYLPAHYIARFSPLRFVDVPKIRTVTNFGDRLVLTNGAYIETVSAVRIWSYEKLVELLETRLSHYTDLSKGLTPESYSDHIGDYWHIAGLPAVIAGSFSDRGAGEIPAVLSLVSPRTGPDTEGWNLSLGGSGGFLFIDPLKSAGRIYSRKGKTPLERPLRLDCVLYVNDRAASPAERAVIERCLNAFTGGEGRGINIRIRFDGKTFEIHEYPARHGKTLIFKGSV